MALFSKNKADDISFEPDSESQEDSTTETETAAPKNNVSNASFKPKSNINYGIQDAIKLVRKLPNVNSDIVISVVIKTLESTNIRVDEIVADATRRETKIEDRSSTLISKIDELQSQISKLNKEITQLNSDLEETSTVKDLLLRSIAQEATQQQASKPVQQQQKPAQHQQQPAQHQQKSAQDATSVNAKKEKDSISAAIDELALEKA